MLEALLKIRFVVVGATPGGLAAAVSLRRAGHQVVLLDVPDPLAELLSVQTCAVPPNMSKLLIRWGLERELAETSVSYRSMLIHHYERGEILGEHIWQDELFKDAGGDFLDMHYADVLRILRDKAVSLGAEIIPDAKVASIEFDEDDRPSVRLASGDVLETDVVVGAERMGMFTRKGIVDDDVPDTSLGMTVFNVLIPREAMAADPQLAPLLEQSKVMYTWWGNSCAALGWLAGVHPRYFLRVNLPEAGTENMLGREVLPDELLSVMGPLEPRLQNLVKLSSSIRCAPLIAPADVETWIHPSERMVILGDAAHPFPVGAMNEASTSVCDAGALGELFRHLHRAEQVGSFLAAFEGLRRPHVRATLAADVANYGVLAMPPGEAHEARDAFLRAKYRAGLGALSGTEEEDETAAQWERDKDFLAYDAEDHAAEWWNDWGLLQERASRRIQIIEGKVPFVEVQQTATLGIEVS